MNILDLIDAALEDWETSPDAVRYNGPKAADVRLYLGNSEPRPGLRPVTLRMLGIAAEIERHMAALTQAERDEFVTYWQASPWSFEQAWGHWVTRRTADSMQAVLTAWGGQFATIMAGLHESMKQFARAFSRKPCGARECFCHPESFPAARDYRRRTKHRNRRRR